MGKQLQKNQVSRLSIVYVLVLLFAAVLCVRLSLWQHARWLEKKQIVSSLRQEETRAPSLILDWSKQPPAFRRLIVSGQWLVNRQFLLANQMRAGRYGYDVITPMKLKGSKAWLLVDRGWVPANQQYDAPDISLKDKRASIGGYVFYPSKRHLVLGDVWLSSKSWPQKTQLLDFSLLAKRLDHRVLPFVLRMRQPKEQAYLTDWVLVSFPPSRHLSYMIQWLVFAGLFLLGAVLLSWKEWRKR